MLLSVLLKQLTPTPIQHDRDITGLSLDSRQIKRGDLFFACLGQQHDGREFIQEAIKKGAVSILVDAEGDNNELLLHNNVSIVPVRNLKEKISEIAARFYQFPAQKMQMIGITGTNGKTSTSHFIAAALTALNFPCGVIGTLGNGIYGQMTEAQLTTPDAITIQKLLADFAKKNIKNTVMEVSSHGLAQYRVKVIDYTVGIFTNLTRDHLDYHETFEAYGAAKKSLFQQTKIAVINVDDAFGREMVASGDLPDAIFTYGINEETAKIRATEVKLDITGIHAYILTPWGEGKLHIPLIGQFNLSNILAALTTLCLLNIDFKTALHAISQIKPVPGRMQALGGRNTALIVVDYAHTPDALEKALFALREHCHRKLYCIFGCGGDRDRGKRPLMAEVAEMYADYVIVTDDNPRFEDPNQIVADIKQGFTQPTKIKVEHDRAKAIKEVMQIASVGDCILIAGKGAETYQIIKDEKTPFSDIAIVQSLI